METSTPGGEANPVKRYLQARNVGLCMCHNRLLGCHVVRSTRPTQYLWPQFTIADEARMKRSPEHLERGHAYPDATYYLNEVQYYFFRNDALRYLRPGQFFRYFLRGTDDGARQPLARRTHDETVVPDDGSHVTDVRSHRHYDTRSSAVAAGDKFPCARVGGRCAAACRRHTGNLCVPRSSFLEPCGPDREAFYKQRLLFGLPWHCTRRPEP